MQILLLLISFFLVRLSSTYGASIFNYNNLFNTFNQQFIPSITGRVTDISERIDDSDFVVVNFDTPHTVTTSSQVETGLSRSIKNLDLFYQKILLVQRSERLEAEVLGIITNWYYDPRERFVPILKCHISVLSKIINHKRKQPNHYVPDSIIKCYLAFIVDKFIIPTTSHCSKDLFHLLMILVQNKSEPALLIPLLEAIRDHKFESHQIKSLFASLNSCFHNYSRNCVFFASSGVIERSKYSLIKLYLTLLKYFEMSFDDFKEIQPKNEFPFLFEAFLRLVPIFRTLLLDRSDESLYNTFILKPNYRHRLEYLKLFNCFLDVSKFNYNFLYNSTAFALKREIFQKIRNSLFQQTSLYDIFYFLLSNNLTSLFNSFLIYSERNEQFIHQISAILELILTRKITFNVYTALLGACPDITVSVLDSIVQKLLTQNPNRNDLNLIYLKGAKRIIMATENVPFAENVSIILWDMPESLECLMGFDDFDSRKAFLFHAARIFLFRQFGIPFTATVFCDDSVEEVDWREMIGFVNFFIERESSLHSITNNAEIPRISTNCK